MMYLTSVYRITAGKNKLAVFLPVVDSYPHGIPNHRSILPLINQSWSGTLKQVGGAHLGSSHICLTHIRIL